MEILPARPRREFVILAAMSLRVPLWENAFQPLIFSEISEKETSMRSSMLLAFGLWAAPVLSGGTVQIVAPPFPPGPAAHGMAKLREAILKRGDTTAVIRTIKEANAPHVIAAGFASDPAVAELIKAGGLKVPSCKEALAVRRIDDARRRTVVLCGADAVGLMYAALDTAQRIRWASAEEDLFAHIRDTSETPCLTDRAVSTYTMQRRWFEQRLYDAEYWERYFDLLAENRINHFVLIFGYENGGFLAPPYPYFFDVEEFPGVRLYGITSQQQAENTSALKRVIASAHERGMRFTVGIWDHIYRGGVQSGGIPGASELAGKKAPHLVYGLTPSNLIPYTKAALKKFLNIFSSLDGIQFRMHWESGLTRKEIPGFWHDIFSMLKRLRPELQLELRAKGLPDQVIDDAVAQGLRFRIATKFWMEQLGMPFHPTHINVQNQRNRRHSYADLLRYPKRYEVNWRIWSGGTARFLLWGDPRYVRRFIQSARLYDGRSFEVNEMLATKMLGRPHDEKPFDLLNPRYRYYRYEFERYWHYYQVWGRVTYDPAAPVELWEHEFTGRFGPKAGPAVMSALHEASNVLPRIVGAAYNYRYFPTTRGWPEVMRLGDLPEYARGTGTDIEQFQSYRAAARALLTGEFTALRTPFQTSRWFEEVAGRILARVEAARAAATGLKDSAYKEFQATITDLKILAHLARYHAARMRAAVWYNVYLKTKDRFALKKCVDNESKAVSRWKKIIESAGDLYPEALKFGVHRVGFSRHWKEELPKLQAGLEKLRRLPCADTLSEATRLRMSAHEAECSLPPSFSIRLDRVQSTVPGKNLVVRAYVTPTVQLKWIRLRYRHVTQFEDYQTVEMTFDPAGGCYIGVIPGSFIVPRWDLMYFAEALPIHGAGCKAPDLDREIPYVIVRVQR